MSTSNVLKRAYTTGYSGSRGLGRDQYKGSSIIHLVDKLDAVLVDIRFSPRSIANLWRKQTLKDMFGDRYLHVGELGNINYDRPEEIKIASLRRGIEILNGLDRVPLLLCVCESPARCHRTVVAQAMTAAGWDVEAIEHWPSIIGTESALRTRL